METQSESDDDAPVQDMSYEDKQPVLEKQESSGWTEKPRSHVSHFEQYPNLPRFIPGIKPMEIHRQHFSEFLQNQPYRVANRASFDEILLTDEYSRPVNLQVGIFAMPEMIFVADEKKSEIPAIHLDFVLRYYQNDWYLEGGIGMGVMRGEGVFDVTYAQYDSVGYYYKVSGFELDEATGKPVFQTTTEGVYDTVEYNHKIMTENRYTYLDLPLNAGLKLRENKRLSVYLKAGAVFSVLINRNEQEAAYVNERATQFSIENQTPDRMQSNLRLAGGVSLQYQFSPGLSLALEPMGSYYMNPVYNRQFNVKSPWSLGLRTGIIFKIKKP